MVFIQSIEESGMETTKKIEVRPFVISVICLFAIETFFIYLFLKEKSAGMSSHAVLRMIEIFIFIMIFKCHENGLESIGLKKSEIVGGIKRGLLWSCGFGVIVLCAAFVLFICGIKPFAMFRFRFSENELEIVIAFVTMGLIGPIAEEVFFRGILFGFFRRSGFWLALVASTLIFVFAHPSAGIVQLVGALLFTVSYEIEKNLLVPIVIHIFGNSAIFAISLFNYLI